MTMIRKERLYLGWWWSQASGAVVGRCSGEVTRCRQTRSSEEDDRGLLCSFLPLPSPAKVACTVRFPKPARNQRHDGRQSTYISTVQWPTTTYIFSINAEEYIQVLPKFTTTTTPKTPTTTTTSTLPLLLLQLLVIVRRQR
jgi:hypothetical protein